MKNIRSIVDGQKKELQENISVYLLTLISGALLSVVFFIQDISKNANIKVYNHIYTILILFLAGCFFTETFFVKNRTDKKWNVILPLYILSAILAVVSDVVTSNIDGLSEKTQYWIIMYFSVFYVVVFVVTIYKIIELNELPLEKYLARVIFGLLKIWGLFALLYIAALLILEIFSALITDIDYWDTMNRIEILLCGFLYFPYTVLVITNTREDNSKFTKGLIMYALMPCVLIATSIIYLYIIKIVASFKLPSNEVFNICAGLFIIGGPIWLMANVFIDDKINESRTEPGIYKKIVGAMPYIYTPFVVLEIICLGIRIAEYGITESRYFGIIFIVFQIIYILWKPVISRLVKDKDYSGLIPALIILLLFATIVPGINANTVSYLSQKNRFEKAISEEDYGEAYGLFVYLECSTYGQDYLDKNYTKEEQKALKNEFANAIDKDENYHGTYKYIYHYGKNSAISGLNISGYSYLYTANNRFNEITKNDLRNLKIKYGNGDNSIEVDFTEAFNYFEENNGQNNPENYVMDIDGNTKLIIYTFSCSVEEYSDKVKYLDIDGYLLIK